MGPSVGGEGRVLHKSMCAVAAVAGPGGDSSIEKKKNKKKKNGNANSSPMCHRARPAE